MTKYNISFKVETPNDISKELVRSAVISDNEGEYLYEEVGEFLVKGLNEFGKISDIEFSFVPCSLCGKCPKCGQ